MSKVKEGNYVVIQSFMVTELNLKGNELIVYAIIYGFSQAENQAFTGSLQYLADWTNSTKQGVLKNLKSLVSKGLIQKKETSVCGVKFCEYYATEFNGVLNKVEQGIKQCLTGGIKQSLTNNIDKDNKENNIYYNSEFENLWKEYPRKQGKDKALKAYVKYRASGGDAEKVKQGIERYKRYIEANKIEQRYIKHGSTWFIGQCWDDEYEETKEVKKNNASYDIDELEKIK